MFYRVIFETKIVNILHNAELSDAIGFLAFAGDPENIPKAT